MTSTNDWTRILGRPGYRVYQGEIEEAGQRLKLWVRRRRNSRGRQCSGCSRWVQEVHEVYERQARDPPWAEYRVAVVVELYRLRCPDCGVKVEKTPQLPSKAPFGLRFEDEVGRACEGAAAAQVARRLGLAASTVRAIDLRYLERWAAARKKPPLKQMGVDEIYLGKKRKFITVVSNLELGEPAWFGKERKRETLDEFFRTQLNQRQRERIEAACMDMWEPFRQSTAEWAPQCKIVYDRFHVMQHANRAVDEVRRAEFFGSNPSAPPGQTTREQRLYISSLAADAPSIARAVRSHWSIENRLHWCMDVSFNDDQMRARTKAAAHNLAVLKHITLNLIRLDPVPRKGGIKARRLIAATSDLYRAQLLDLA